MAVKEKPGVARKDKSELALKLYLHTSLTQKEICDKVGWTEATFTANKEKGNWKTLKAAHGTTRENVIMNLYMQVSMITDTASEEKRMLNSKEADMIAKLSNSIDKLSKKESLSGYIQVFDTFSKWLLKTKPELAKELIGYQDDFIGIKINELS